MFLTLISNDVPFRTVMTGPAKSAPRRAVAKPREETTSERTFIVLIAFPPIYQLRKGSQWERDGSALGMGRVKALTPEQMRCLNSLHSPSRPGRFPSVNDCSRS